MYQPRLQDLTRQQVLKYNEIKRILKKGKIPACLLSPVLLRQHNDTQPEIAHIKYGDQEVCIDALILNYCADGIAARKAFRDGIYAKPTTNVEPIDEDNTMVAMSRQDRVMYQRGYDE